MSPLTLIPHFTSIGVNSKSLINIVPYLGLRLKVQFLNILLSVKRPITGHSNLRRSVARPVTGHVTDAITLFSFGHSLTFI